MKELHQVVVYRSLPSWECGLKSAVTLNDKEPQVVTPFVGVWIEIYQTKQPKLNADVTPFVGVWIEIFWLGCTQ